MNLLSSLRRSSARLLATWIVVVASAITTPHMAVSAGPERPPDVIIPIKTPRGAVIYAELADTPVKRSQGLMFRETLAANRGMLFTFGDTQSWSFWMKNTKLPLDIIWLDPKKTIVHIERNVPICTKTDDSCPQYRPNNGAMFVLEINGGRADALDLQGGKKLEFKLP